MAFINCYPLLMELPLLKLIRKNLCGTHFSRGWVRTKACVLYPKIFITLLQFYILSFCHFTFKNYMKLLKTMLQNSHVFCFSKANFGPLVRRQPCSPDVNQSSFSYLGALEQGWITKYS